MINDALKFLTAFQAESSLQIGLNINPIFDLYTTTMIKGKNGVWFQNGGLMPVNGLAGGNNTQKTGLAVDFCANLLYRFSKSIIIYGDTESTLDISRLGEKVDGLYGIPGYFDENILGTRFIYMPYSEGYDGTAYHNTIIDIYKRITALKDSKDKDERQAYEDLQLDTPFWSKKTNSFVTFFTPILFVNDSISETMFDKLMFKQFDEGEMDDGGKKRTRDMEIGNLRRIMMSDISLLGPRVGVRSLWIAQTSDVINMDGRPKEKDTTFLRQNKKISAPKAILKLPHVGYEIIKGVVLKQPDQTLTYPRANEAGIVLNAKAKPDLIEYQTTLFRNKSGISGGDQSFIAGQEEGICVHLSMYDTLKDNGYFGLIGNNTRHVCALYPHVTLTRPTVRDKIESDPKLRRALEFTYFLFYMSTFWSNFPVEWRVKPEDLYNMIVEQGINWDELYDTVYFWHDNHEFIKQPTLTLYELMEIAVNKKPIYWKENK